MDVKTTSNECLAISFTQQFEVTKSLLGGLKVTTLAYGYSIENISGHEILAYHWHPDDSRFKFPHLHIGHAAGAGLRAEIRNIHFRTDRMAFEDFSLQLIREFGVVPDRDDAEQVLESNLEKFRNHRTWK
jgi:hypothetical protein